MPLLRVCVRARVYMRFSSPASTACVRDISNIYKQNTTRVKFNNVEQRWRQTTLFDSVSMTFSIHEAQPPKDKIALFPQHPPGYGDRPAADLSTQGGGGDSNPRGSSPGRFQDGCIRPLCHPSAR